MAPLFFALLAEGSLAWRRNQLNELRDAKGRVQELGDRNRKRFAAHARHAAADSQAEEDAVRRGDLFNDPLPYGYEFEPDEQWDGSPFADYLRKLARDLARPEFVDLESDKPGSVSGLPSMPGYRICSEDLTNIAPENNALNALHCGTARLSSIPDELMSESATDRRQAWLEGKLSAKTNKRRGIP